MMPVIIIILSNFTFFVNFCYKLINIIRNRLIMSKKNVKPGFIQKISQYFKFLCSSEMKEDKS